MLVSKVSPPQCFLSDCALPTAWPGRPPGPACALQSESLCLSEFSHRPPSFVAREGAGETGSSRGSVPCSAPGPGALLANVFIAPSELSAAAEVIVISPSAAWPWLWSLVLPSTVYQFTQFVNLTFAWHVAQDGAGVYRFSILHWRHLLSGG